MLLTSPACAAEHVLYIDTTTGSDVSRCLRYYSSVHSAEAADQGAFSSPAVLARPCSSKAAANAAVAWASDASGRPSAWLITLRSIEAGEPLLVYQGALVSAHWTCAATTKCCVDLNALCASHPAR